MSNEKRLIDANELLERILSLTLTVTGLRAGKGVLLELLNKYRNGILQLVNEQPTVDAVEVVQCKDCVFSTYVVECGLRKCRTPNGLFRTVEDNDFCSYGERRTE